MKHYLKDVQNVVEELNSSENGLSSSEAEQRLQENGKNKLVEAEKYRIIKKFLKIGLMKNELSWLQFVAN